MKDEDTRFRELFAGLRRAPEAPTPSFETLMGAAEEEAGKRHARRVLQRRAAAWILLLGGGWAALHWLASAPGPRPAELAPWRSPTARLLAPPLPPRVGTPMHRPLSSSPRIPDWSSPTRFLLRPPARSEHRSSDHDEFTRNRRSA